MRVETETEVIAKIDMQEVKVVLLKRTQIVAGISVPAKTYLYWYGDINVDKDALPDRKFGYIWDVITSIDLEKGEALRKIRKLNYECGFGLKNNGLLTDPYTDCIYRDERKYREELEELREANVDVHIYELLKNALCRDYERIKLEWY